MFPTAGIVAGLIAGVAVLDLSIKEYVEKHIEPGERRWLPGKAAVLKKIYNRGFALDTLDKEYFYAHVCSMSFFRSLAVAKEGEDGQCTWYVSDRGRSHQ